jgi:hypothetical protein
MDVFWLRSELKRAGGRASSPSSRRRRSLRVTDSLGSTNSPGTCLQGKGLLVVQNWSSNPKVARTARAQQKTPFDAQGGKNEQAGIVKRSDRAQFRRQGFLPLGLCSGDVLLIQLGFGGPEARFH